jgi:hypothetical protein
MNLTKRQKLLSAVFLLGVVGLGVDRVILRPQGGPQAASADTPVAAAPSAKPPAPPAENPPARPPVAERLNNLLPARQAGAEEPRDPFALPPAWTDSPAASGEKVPDTVAAFIRTHQLKAVVVQGEASSALVDDSYLAPGQNVDGFKLVSVSYRTAVFEREGKQAVLELVDSEGPGSKGPSR